MPRFGDVAERGGSKQLARDEQRAAHAFEHDEAGRARRHDEQADGGGSAQEPTSGFDSLAHALDADVSIRPT